MEAYRVTFPATLGFTVSAESEADARILAYYLARRYGHITRSVEDGAVYLFCSPVLDREALTIGPSEDE